MHSCVIPDGAYLCEWWMARRDAWDLGLLRRFGRLGNIRDVVDRLVDAERAIGWEDRTIQDVDSGFGFVDQESAIDMPMSQGGGFCGCGVSYGIDEVIYTSR